MNGDDTGTSPFRGGLEPMGLEVTHIAGSRAEVKH